MKPLLILGGSLAAIFASTFLILALFGGFGAEDVRNLVESVSQVDPLWVAVLVVVLLFADLFVAMPTLTLCILSGYYLGPWAGGATASCGMLLAGFCGYAISQRVGLRLLRWICSDESKLEESVAFFDRRGPIVLLLCRASPILPEVSCCLAGATRMPFARFLSYYCLATVPYAFIASRAGAMSSLDDPRPALFAAIGISGSLWFVWWRMAARWKTQSAS